MLSRNLFYLFALLMLFILFIRIMSIDVIGYSLVIEIVSWGTLVFMFLAIGHLQPQVNENDERTKYIKKKTMYYSLKIILVFVFALTIILQTNLLMLDSIAVLGLLIAFSAVTIFTVWIFIFKQN